VKTVINFTKNHFSFEVHLNWKINWVSKISEKSLSTIFVNCASLDD